MKYIYLPPDTDLPDIFELEPFRAIVVVESPVSANWQALVSSWLVRSGCRYMMAWGIDCSSWDDSVDFASIEADDFQEIPDDRFVMTTWHDDVPLDEVFFFAKHCALHPVLDLKNLAIVHITKNGAHDFSDTYASA